MNLLIVDDEVITVNGILNGIDWALLPFEQVFSANSADEARDILQEQTVQMMLCDIEMPGEGGIALLRWVREQGMDLECIFLTCHDEFQYAQKALQLQGMDYLLKPVPYEELQEILRQASEKVEQKYVDTRYKEYGKSHKERFRESAAENIQKKNSKIIVEEIKVYIQEHLQEDLSVELLAKKAYVSTPYLFQIFKKEEQTTLIEYITRARMFYASELLKQNDIPVSRVAMAVGYSNYCYFTKLFKKSFGVTPSQYQREHKKV